MAPSFTAGPRPVTGSVGCPAALPPPEPPEPEAPPEPLEPVGLVVEGLDVVVVGVVVAPVVDGVVVAPDWLNVVVVEADEPAVLCDGECELP